MVMKPEHIYSTSRRMDSTVVAAKVNTGVPRLEVRERERDHIHAICAHWSTLGIAVPLQSTFERWDEVQFFFLAQRQQCGNSSRNFLKLWRQP